MNRETMTDAGIVTVTYMFDLHMTEVLNINQRLNKFERARRTAAIRGKAVAARLQHRPPVQDRDWWFERARLDPLIQFRDRRRRDRINYAPTIKAAVDGIVSGPSGARGWPHGLLPDDDAEHLIEGPTELGWDGNLRPYWIRLALKFTKLD